MGVRMADTITISTMGARNTSGIMPLAIPLLATISATSPRDTMPTPMRRLSALV